MIKIHSGKLKGQNINRVLLNTTRETASMVREAVFNSLFNISGNVLDLFAGSGSYGITAYSLGATNVYFIDSNLKAYQTVKSNLAKLKINGYVYKADYNKFLDKNTIKFDYIFIDPPFDFNKYLELIETLKSHLNKDAKVIIEIDNKTKLEINDENYEIIKEKKYGNKRVIILNFKTA